MGISATGDEMAKEARKAFRCPVTTGIYSMTIEIKVLAFFSTKHVVLRRIIL